MLNASEQATLHFYEWEKRLRGHYHFDTAVALEPYYTPFELPEIPESNQDDGKVTSFFHSFFSLPQTEQGDSSEETEEAPKLAYIYEPTFDLVGFSISFPHNSEIQPQLFRTCIELLSFTKEPISFEIVGQHDLIQIQIISSPEDKERIVSQLKAYFPHIIITDIDDVFDFGIDKYSGEVTIVDFGLSEEVMRPIKSDDTFRIDPLTSIIGSLENLGKEDTAIFQMIFKGVQSPWHSDLQYSVSDGMGGSFFMNSPEMPQLAEEKTSSSLFAVVMRVAVESSSIQRSEYIATELVHNILMVSQSPYNALIPLNNKDYSYDQHLRNVFLRCTNRLGFILNSHELATFVHYPNNTIVSSKLGLGDAKTKAIPSDLIGRKYILGINEHNGEKREVSISDQMKLRHTHIIGATGVGKSTLLSTMMLDDINRGNGCALFDPHGDIVEDILSRIPEHRKDDVIIIDPSDIENPIGFNILKCHSEAEKIVLSSDLVSAFRRQSHSWGDVMTAVLTNSVTAFLESSRGGTLIELKRFLLEERFRKEFLETVDDPSIQYYWEREYPMVKKSITPLLTRIDIFLRPKIIRYMFAQQEGIDFRDCIEKKKIVLIKLSQGLIGEQNSFLLASLFLAKFNQVAMGRQQIEKSERHPFYIYCDEFQNYVTDSIQSILSGARKYGLGLILAHQELEQISDTKILNSVISNPYTRICFRLGDNDAKRLESGFSYFEQSNLQNLGIGQAIARVGSAQHDFNLRTSPLAKTDEFSHAIREYIIQNTREKYATPKSEVENILRSLLPNNREEVNKKEKVIEKKSNVITNEKVEVNRCNKDVKGDIEITQDNKITKEDNERKTAFQEEVKELIQQEEDSKRIKNHQYLQQLVKKMGQGYGFLATIEKELPNGKRIDITLERESRKIAVECAVNNSVEYEIKNISKALKYDYNPIIVISKNRNHLDNIKKRSRGEFDEKEFEKLKFIQPQGLSNILLQYVSQKTTKQEIIKGYRIITEYESDKKMDAQSIRESIAKKLFRKK